MRKHIVHAAHTPSHVLDKLEKCATETRIRLEAKCPACEVNSNTHRLMSAVMPVMRLSLSANSDTSAMT